MLSAVAYLSTATGQYEEVGLRKLLEDARSFNDRVSVTGVLLYRKGSFFQYFEGTTEATSLIYQRVRESKSHHRIVELLNDTILEREFPDWNMGILEPVTDPMLWLSQASWAVTRDSLERSQRSKSDGILYLHSFIRAQQSAA